MSKLETTERPANETQASFTKGHASYANRRCPACDLLPFEVLTEEQTPPLTTIELDGIDVEALHKQSSKCDFCRALIDLREHWLSDERDRKLFDEGFAYHDMCGRSDWRLRYTDHTYLGLFVDFDSVLSKRVNDRYIHSRPLSDQTLKQVKHWISKCERKHQKCFDHPLDLPTRVIDVRSTRLKLLDPSPTGSHQYVALSHCWGMCRDFLTTRENVDDRRAGFELMDLPATFRDAVTATRILQIPFLWIDSICILQGDRDDWEIEGSKMAEVYSNATLCIAAADANDDAEGFLKPRRQQPVLAVDITLSLPTMGDRQMKTRLYTQLPVTRPGLHEQYPALHNRAWCLQERYLSPRILFFDRDSMHWECLQDVWLEAGRNLPKHREMLPDIMPLRSSTEELSHRPWCRMIHNYTTRAISYASDKLPAVSALASRVAQETGDEYLAGLWRSDLVRILVWYRCVRHRFRSREAAGPWRVDQPRPEIYLAPSWSWASYLGVVEFQTAYASLYVLPSVKLIDAAVVVPGRNKYGEVESGSLTLLSPLLTFEEHPPLFDVAKGWKYGWTHDSLESPDLRDLDVTISSCFDYPNETRQGWLLGVPLAYEDLAERQEDRDDQQPDPQDTPERPWLEVYGVLVVEKQDDEKVYERVGCFSIGPVHLDEFLDVLRSAWIQETRIV